MAAYKLENQPGLKVLPQAAAGTTRVEEAKPGFAMRVGLLRSPLNFQKLAFQLYKLQEQKREKNSVSISMTLPPGCQIMTRLICTRCGSEK